MITWQTVKILKKWYDESECAEIFALGNDDNNKIIKTTKIQAIQVKEKVSSITSINLIIYCMIFNLLLFQQMELKVQTIINAKKLHQIMNHVHYQHRMVYIFANFF